MDQLKNELRRLWSQHPHAKIWFIVTSVVIIMTLIITLYYLNSGEQDLIIEVMPTPSVVSEVSTIPSVTPTPSPTAKTSTEKSAKTPDSSTVVTPSPVSSNKTVQTLASELRGIDVNGLSDGVRNLENIVGQFKN